MTHQKAERLTPMNEIQRRFQRENLAKSAYGIYCHRTGATDAWEQLTNVHRQAWIECVEFLMDEPICSTCDQYMYCPDCEVDRDAECPRCLRSLTCPACTAKDLKKLKSLQAASDQKPKSKGATQ